jgi:hypothetical protein
MVSLWMLNKNRYIHAWSLCVAWWNCITEIISSNMNWTLVFSDDLYRLLLWFVAWSGIVINWMWLYLRINSVMPKSTTFISPILMASVAYQTMCIHKLSLWMDMMSCHWLCPNSEQSLWLNSLTDENRYLLDFLPLPMMQKAEAKLSWIRTDIYMWL